MFIFLDGYPERASPELCLRPGTYQAHAVRGCDMRLLSVSVWPIWILEGVLQPLSYIQISLMYGSGWERQGYSHHTDISNSEPCVSRSCPRPSAAGALLLTSVVLIW